MLEHRHGVGPRSPDRGTRVERISSWAPPAKRYGHDRAGSARPPPTQWWGTRRSPLRPPNNDHRRGRTGRARRPTAAEAPQQPADAPQAQTATPTPPRPHSPAHRLPRPPARRSRHRPTTTPLRWATRKQPAEVHPPTATLRAGPPRADLAHPRIRRAWRHRRRDRAAGTEQRGKIVAEVVLEGEGVDPGEVVQPRPLPRRADPFGRRDLRPHLPAYQSPLLDEPADRRRSTRLQPRGHGRTPRRRVPRPPPQRQRPQRLTTPAPPVVPQPPAAPRSVITSELPPPVSTGYSRQ
jgi:hypothetical protein